MRGRRGECSALEQLTSTARSGRSQVLVLRGEAGIGKTALLDFAAERAAGFRAARVAGVESEMELAFAGLQQLCAPFLDRIDGLPEPQREALDIAFGRRHGPAPDRFLVGLAVLNLIAAVAESQPLILLVDDTQWVDRISAQTLAFVARRLIAEPVALIFAMRDGFEDEFDGLPELTVRGLNPGDARALLDSVILGRLDDQVRDRIVAETRGNPLALLELPRGLTAAELAGGFERPDVRPLAGQIEQTFLRRIRSLPDQTQQLLLTAAAEPVGDAALLTRAANRLGLPPDAVARAEAVGLIDVGTRVRFRHPLVRSAAYRSADLMERRRVHRALAEATDSGTDPDRRAWHLAIAAPGPDEEVAAALERSADRAQARGGVAAAAAFLERATQLTADPARRGTRALAAAQAKRDVAAFDAADELLAIAESASLDQLQRARAVRLRAQITFARSRTGASDAPTVSDAAAGLLDAARGLETLDDAVARETYLEALGAALFGGRLCPNGGIQTTARAARAAPTGPQPTRPVDLLLDGIAIWVTAGHAASVPALREALHLVRAAAARGDDDVMRWFWLAFPLVQESAAHEVWDDDLWHHLATDAVRLARDAGALAVLPHALVYRAGVHVQAGELASATALVEEAGAIAAATGYAPLKYQTLLLAAWRGAEADALKFIDAATEGAVSRGEGRIVGLANYTKALLYNGLGRYNEALAAARRCCEHEDLGVFGFCLIELVEAAARGGAPDAGRAALRQLEERALVTETDWAAGVLAWSRALLADDQSAEAHYQEAIDRLQRTRIAVQLARAHLVYGEWLRRCNRRIDARAQLQTAYEMFGRMGAQAFAARARRELLVTGQKVSKRSAAPGHELTPQEAQIARLAGDGLTNPEIAAQLFISTHTVEWHLRKVFAKLGISSRRQLRGCDLLP
ncbi:LuxR family transcriptional regulator [Mycobacterium florentinum]|uniref:LuxR family transcriptional regulator n=1 Tax=Mycobacterium florentinum TaxID=292462 RepID=A0A1X1U3S9_MYCFL|nr:LuxR family transcriptional regulator [Mycobacterium florentinum]MCV7411175.1 AAA family ATPase [Mycobacterium florentinum]ORV51485.1 LuxR family transcriptional regulator [Mycobacterium florentinum]